MLIGGSVKKVQRSSTESCVAAEALRLKNIPIIPSWQWNTRSKNLCGDVTTLDVDAITRVTDDLLLECNAANDRISASEAGELKEDIIAKTFDAARRHLEQNRSPQLLIATCESPTLAQRLAAVADHYFPRAPNQTHQTHDGSHPKHVNTLVTQHTYSSSNQTQSPSNQIVGQSLNSSHQNHNGFQHNPSYQVHSNSHISQASRPMELQAHERRIRIIRNPTERSSGHDPDADTARELHKSMCFRMEQVFIKTWKEMLCFP
ncbi:hypothetical protein ACJJTC_018623 [Scirpophaga incertulas]